MAKTMIGRAAGFALATAMLSGAAAAQFSPNNGQRNAIEHVTQVMAGSAKCDDYALNERFFAVIQLSAGFSINDPETYAYIEERAIFHAKRIKDRTRDDICGAMTRLYGPKGEAVSGLAIKVK